MPEGDDSRNGSSTEDPLRAGDLRELRSRIGLLVSGTSNRRLLTDQLWEYDVVALTDDPPSLDGVDLLVLDEYALRDYRDQLGAWREAADPEYLPYLYLAPPSDVPRKPPRALWDHVDDIIRRPVSPDELRGRIGSLLRARRYASDLAAQNARLEALTGMLAHDLRNPLSTALGHVQLLNERDDTEEGRVVERALERMDDIIDDVLALAKHGEPVSAPTIVHLASVASDAWELAGANDATLVIPTDLGTCRAARSRLQELFENLFANAVRYGSDDVTVEVGRLEDGFYVADDGPGIPAEDRESVFEYGYTTSQEGTGFGLAIVAEIATAHGWNVALADNDTGGARFEFTGMSTQ